MKKDTQILEALALKVKEGGQEGENARVALKNKCVKMGLNIEDYLGKEQPKPPPKDIPWMAQSYVKGNYLYFQGGGKTWKLSAGVLFEVPSSELWS
jgi:hypothetical protein